MKPSRVISRELAKQDIEAAFDHYLSAAGSDVAIAFVDEMERTFTQISQNPLAGSPRYSHEIDLPDLRFWRVRRFPYLVFYVVSDEYVDVWRISHAHSDIPSWMRDPDSVP